MAAGDAERWDAVCGEESWASGDQLVETWGESEVREEDRNWAESRLETGAWRKGDAESG